jgi:hypothetical protein
MTIRNESLELQEEIGRLDALATRCEETMRVSKAPLIRLLYWSHARSYRQLAKKARRELSECVQENPAARSAAA